MNKVLAGKLFFIPDYQRPYAWEGQQLAELWEDLDLMGPAQHHYAGTLVLMRRPEDASTTSRGELLEPFDVVDGQQRLTTCFILLDRIRRRFEMLSDLDEDAVDKAADLRHTFGLLKVRKQSRPRLSLGSGLNDLWASQILMDDKISTGEYTDAEYRLLHAAQFFDARLDELLDGDGQPNLARLEDLLGRVRSGLRFLVYEVASSSEIGVIFETLNARGRPLSELEKIKNYLLFLIRHVKDGRQEALASLINTTWGRVFSNLSGSRIAGDDLARIHWLITQNPDSRSWHGSSSVKTLFSRSKFVPSSARLANSVDATSVAMAELHDELAEGVEKYVKTLGLAAGYLGEIQDAHPTLPDLTSHSSEVSNALAAFRRAGYPANFRPLIVAALMARPHDGEFLENLVRACEAYAARVFIIAQRRADAGRTQLHRMAFNLWTGVSTPTEILNQVAALTRTYANDDQVRAGLAVEERWYPRAGHKYFLYEYELKLTKGRSAVPAFETFTGKGNEAKTTEHILPQHPDWESSDWRQFTEEEHAALRHSLGNLVLTYDNSSYGRKAFAAKRGSPTETQSPCYARAPLAQEREVAVFADWTPSTISQRQKKLVEFALERWHVPPAAPDVIVAVEDLEDEIDSEEDES
nr:DUF262 domain-containing protein [Janibacter alkaliphilus]